MKKILAGCLMALLLVVFMTGCKSEGGGGPAPAPDTALGYVILAKTAISTVPTSVVTGNMGISPQPATAITGFSLVADASNEFSTSAQVTGKIYAADYATPTPANLTAAVLDMETMYTDLAGLSPDETDLYIDLAGQTVTPGVYKFTGALTLSSGFVTLSGSGEYVFQIGGALTTAAATEVKLAGGAQPQDIKWVVTGASLGATSIFKGVILSSTAITVGANATVNGRLLAQSAVSLDKDTVTQP